MAGGKIGSKDVGLLILRLTLGGIVIAHGVTKLIEGINVSADALASLGLPYPYPLAIAVIAAEIGGGALLVLGVASAVGALAIASLLVLAIVKIHWRNGFFLRRLPRCPGQIPHGYEYALACVAMALCVLLTGPGTLRSGSRGRRKARGYRFPPRKGQRPR